jgi:hypothetical protein
MQTYNNTNQRFTNEELENDRIEIEKKTQQHNRDIFYELSDFMDEMKAKTEDIPITVSDSNINNNNVNEKIDFDKWIEQKLSNLIIREETMRLIIWAIAHKFVVNNSLKEIEYVKIYLKKHRRGLVQIETQGQHFVRFNEFCVLDITMLEDYNIAEVHGFFTNGKITEIHMTANLSV